MEFEKLVIDEDLRIDSGNKSLNTLFRNYIDDIFSKSFVNKIDRIFDGILKFKDFKKRNNVMCYTQGTNIFVNRPLFDSLPNYKRVKYLIHEFLHVLDNSKRFPEIDNIQRQLVELVNKMVPKNKIALFLTGKDQNIHSDWRKEVLTYLANNSIRWDIAKDGMKEKYKEVLKNSGIFDMGSYFWKRRLDK